MELWSNVVVPLRKVWFRVAKRLGIRKTGLVKLYRDVRTCEYEDVHVLWEMLNRNDANLTRSARQNNKNKKGEGGHFWNIVNWARRARFVSRNVR